MNRKEKEIDVYTLNKVVDNVKRAMPLLDDHLTMKNLIIAVIESMIPKESIEWFEKPFDELIGVKFYDVIEPHRIIKITGDSKIVQLKNGEVYLEKLHNTIFWIKANGVTSKIVEEPNESKPLSENTIKGNIKLETSNEKECPPPPPPIRVLKEGEKPREMSKELEPTQLERAKQILRDYVQSPPEFNRGRNKSEPTETDDRYNMCSDQPAQIDCRNSDCTFYKSGACINVSPAITLNPDKTFVCWSKKNEKPQEKTDTNKEKAKEIMNKWGLLDSEGKGNPDIICAVLEAVGFKNKH